MADRLYRIRMAAEMSGVSEGLIRAWERRYGLVKPRRTPGGYRAYTEQDIALLRRLRQLTEEGVSIAEASRLVPDLRRELKEASTEPSGSAADASQVERIQRGILEAARRFDQLQVEGFLDEAFSLLPPLAVFEKILVPVQQEVGDRWHKGELTVAEEHLVTQAVRARLLALFRTTAVAGARHVVCACFPDEEHEIGLLGAALRLRQAGFRVTYLGQRTPADELGRAVKSARPEAVALSAVSDAGRRGFRSELERIVTALPSRTRVLIGGAAARKYPEVCEALGATLVDTPEQWSAVLR